MKHLFVPYALALILKEKGFDEECLSYFEPKLYTDPNGEQIVRSIIKTTFLNGPYPDTDKFTGYRNSVKEMFNKEIVAAPLYQQVIDWLREKHGLSLICGGPYNHTDSPFQYTIDPWKRNKAGRMVSTMYTDYYTALSKGIEHALKLIP